MAPQVRRYPLIEEDSAFLRPLAIGPPREVPPTPD